MNSSNLPSFSFIVPVLNGVDYLEQSIKSVLGQNYPKNLIEYVVADGGSTDGTLKILEKYNKTLNFCYLTGKDKSIADGFNKAYKMSKGDIINWFDADNLLEPDFLKRVADIYIKGYNFIYSDFFVFGDGIINRSIQKTPKLLNFKIFLEKGCVVCNPAVFLSRELVETVGLPDENIKIGPDYDWWLRIFKNSEVRPWHFDKPLAAYRIHSDSAITRDKLRGAKAAYLISRKHGGGYFSYPHIAYLICKYKKITDFVKKYLPTFYNLMKKVKSR